MVVLRSESQVKSFVKRQSIHYKKTLKYCSEWGDVSRDATVSVEGAHNKLRVLLRTTECVAGCGTKISCEVLAIVKIRSRQ